MVTSFIANQAIKKGLNFIKNPSIGSLLGGSVVSLFGRGTNASQAMKLQYNYQRLLQQQQYDLTQRGYRESPANQRIGLEAAGYNPLLAVTNGVQYGSYSSGQSSAVSDAAEQTNASSNRFNSAINAMSAIAGLKATNASAEKMSQEAQTEVYKRENLWQDSMLKRSMEVLNNEEAPWIAKKAAAQIANMYMTGQAAVTGANAQTIAANAQQLNAETNAEWTPGKLGASIGLGALGVLGTVYGPAKFKVLKALGKAGRKVGF